METLPQPAPTPQSAYQWHEDPQPDLPELADFLTACHPERPTAAAELERQEALRLPGEPFARVLVRRGGSGGALVGLASVSVPNMDGHPGWFMVGLAAVPDEVSPNAESGPLPAELLAWAEARALAFGARTLVARVREDHWERALYEAHGYAEHDRMWHSVLDLGTLDEARFAHHEARAQAAGVRFVPLSAFGPFDEALQRRLYTLIAALLRDVPSTTPVSVWPFEVWQQRIVPQLKDPAGVWLAVAPSDGGQGDGGQDGEWIGVNEVHLPSAAYPGHVLNGLTGVLAAWRGQGVAYALKLAGARSARKRGYTHIRTGNHSVNRPMLAINEALGFVREAALVTLKKDVGGGV